MPPRAKPLSPDDRRKALVEATIPLLLEHGRAVTTKQIADAAGVANLWVHPGDAMPLLTDRVPAASLAAVHLFFPDPWPKNKHAKRRFVQQHTLDLLASRLAPGGVLRIATDIAAYAAHARAQLAHHGRWDVVEGERPDWRPDDGFEAKGVRVGRTPTEVAQLAAEIAGSLR